MTFLPVVERELRIAARKRFTYWLRLAAAGFLLFIFGIYLLFWSIGPAGMGMSLGQMVFTALKWLAFIFAAAWGLFLPSDSVSEEKREGTLGLLFLTDLRGYDVVFGKLMSLGLQSFYALLAGFPIIALPVLAGGVTGVEFWRTALAICNTLFFSVAIGLLASSMSREVVKAMNTAALISLFFFIGLPWMDSALAHLSSGSGSWKCVVSIASPGYLFSAAPGMWPAEFWKCLLFQHLIAWLFLVTACLIVPRSWQEKEKANRNWTAALATRWRFGGAKARLRFRRRWIERQPVLWLALRDRSLPRLARVVTVAGTALIGWYVYDNWGKRQSPALAGSLSFPLELGLVLWVAIQATRLYFESARSGAMELMLVTPLPPEQIVRSQWSALWRTYSMPVFMVLALSICQGMDQVLELKKTLTATKTALPVNRDILNYQIVMLCGQNLNFVFRLAAVAWFGMWTGLTSRKITIAVLKTMVFVVVLPWLAGVIVQIGCVMIFGFAMGGMRAGIPQWFWMVPPLALELAKNIFFIRWSRKRLLFRFRQIVSESGQSSHAVLRPVASSAPPIIPTPAIS